MLWARSCGGNSCRWTLSVSPFSVFPLCLWSVTLVPIYRYGSPAFFSSAFPFFLLLSRLVSRSMILVASFDDLGSMIMTPSKLPFLFSFMSNPSLNHIDSWTLPGAYFSDSSYQLVHDTHVHIFSIVSFIDLSH